jgi:deoxyribodipyrimidine photolyase-related protein
MVIVFPHQLFREHPALGDAAAEVLLVEDALFFGDRHYPCRFHKQKLWLHRASMKRYAESLAESGRRVHYLDYEAERPALDRALDHAHERGVQTVVAVDPTDFILEKRLRAGCAARDLELTLLENPNFINDRATNRRYRESKRRWHMADFYKAQRKRLRLLMEDDEPLGGKWSFDEENRKKVPKKLLGEIPQIPAREPDEIERDARDYVELRFPDNPGRIDELFYATGHDAAEHWLDRFAEERLTAFGPYEDAIVEGESWLWHSVLTPMLNIGLLEPHAVLDAAVARDAPLNSVEGFVRQVAGWREFMRATYEDLGVTMRTTNHWRHTRPMPACFYDGTTGIAPVDDTIRRILRTGYCHHIERLMVLGGFMFLCEIDPDAIYRWFMELFVDSYDWVMVPNVYAMSQNADGGLVTTKPYFSGSAYVRKMSHYKKGPWCESWDGLYWRWIWLHADELSKNPRWSMMCSQVKKMDADKRQRHLDAAESFLSNLDEG